MTSSLPAPLALIWRPALQRLALLARQRGCEVVLAGDGADEWLAPNAVIAADLLRSFDIASLYRLWQLFADSFHFSRRAAFRIVVVHYALRQLLPDAYYATASRVGAHHLARQRWHTAALRAAAGMPWIAPDPTLRATVTERLETSFVRAATEPRPDSYFLREHFALNPPVVSRQVNDLALGVLYKTCQTMMGDSWRPQCVCLNYERPAQPDRAIYDRLFDCELQFGSDFHGIVVSANDMTRQNPRADVALSGHARQLVRAMIDPGDRTLTEEVEQSIWLLMPAGRANIAGVADAIGTNIRTLQRRLDGEKTSFSELLDKVRVQQVSQHFANRRLRLTDIAHLLGYSTLASFSAWYRSRFHETPTKARHRTRQPMTKSDIRAP